MCLSLKPVVDGLERDLEGTAIVLRADIQSDAGGEVARRYGVEVVPSFVVLGPSGEVLFSREGARGVPGAEIRRAVRDARSEY